MTTFAERLRNEKEPTGRPLTGAEDKAALAKNDLLFHAGQGYYLDILEGAEVRRRLTLEPGSHRTKKDRNFIGTLVLYRP